jgi:outer membrane lipoprotein-sorting protein
MEALFWVLLAAQAEPADDPAAQAALRRLAERFRDARTLSARVSQSRKTSLLDRPVTSSGTLYYRREPARLVFHMTEPRPAEIHLDRAAYQVHRPDEKRLERLDFEGEDLAPRLLMVFEPKAEEMGRTFRVGREDAPAGEVRVVLEPRDDKVRRHLRRLSLALAEGDGALRRIAYTDAEGDEVVFTLTELKVNPELAPGLFELKVPEGTRILRHAVKLDK